MHKIKQQSYELCGMPIFAQRAVLTQVLVVGYRSPAASSNVHEMAYQFVVCNAIQVGPLNSSTNIIPLWNYLQRPSSLLLFDFRGIETVTQRLYRLSIHGD